jgi:hypothetical protein
MRRIGDDGTGPFSLSHDGIDPFFRSYQVAYGHAPSLFSVAATFASLESDAAG